MGGFTSSPAWQLPTQLLPAQPPSAVPSLACRMAAKVRGTQLALMLSACLKPATTLPLHPR